MKIELKRLTDINTSDLIELMNQPLLQRHMPLLGDSFGEEECITFVDAKGKLWDEHGYGPWAFVVDGELAGWGGLQPEDGDAGIGLVIHPRFWGIGPELCKRIIRIGFEDMQLESLTMIFLQRAAAKGGPLESAIDKRGPLRHCTIGQSLGAWWRS